MARKLNNYLKTHRKRASLSQDEVAFLVGTSGGAKVSRYERARRVPSLETAFAYEALFGVPARELFAGVYETVERGLRGRAQRLAQGPKVHPSQAVALKLIAGSGAQSRSHTHAQLSR
jgi:transcriptional regulator with XRE-family HTH domain